MNFKSEIKNENEYPKSVFLPFIGYESVDESLMAYYALLSIKSAHSELMIFRNPETFVSDQDIQPDDVYAGIFTNQNPGSFKEFKNIYLQNKCGINGFSLVNGDNNLNLCYFMLPEDESKKQGLPPVPVVSFYNRETEAVLYRFFREWEDRYVELKKEEGVH